MSIISDNYTCNPELVDSDAPNIVLSHFAVTAINRLDESLQHLQELPHVRLAFCHLKLLSNRLVSGYQSNTNEIVEGALSIVNQLQAPNTSSAPFGHHIAALAAITLAESLKLPSHTSKALDGLQSLQTTLSASRLTFYPFTADKTVWNTSILAYITKKVEEHAASTSQTLNNDVDMPAGTRGGLQHLADAAVGNSNDNDGNNAQDGGHLVPVDFTKAGRKGYLTFFE